jgi:hypothetical protein
MRYDRSYFAVVCATVPEATPLACSMSSAAMPAFSWSESQRTLALAVSRDNWTFLALGRRASDANVWERGCLADPPIGCPETWEQFHRAGPHTRVTCRTCASALLDIAGRPEWFAPEKAFR